MTRIVTYFPKIGLHIKKETQFRTSSAVYIISEYFESGKLKSKSKQFYMNGPIETLNYYETGEPHLYSFYDSTDSQFYQREYNRQGALINEKGFPFFVSYTNSKSGIFKTKDSIKAFFIAPTPPDCKTYLYTLEQNTSISNIFQDGDNPIFKVDIYPLEKGKYQWLVYLALENKTTGEIKKTSPKDVGFTVE